MKGTRIVKIKNNIIITNYKCMFCSLNLLKIDKANPKINYNSNIIFLYRSTVSRVISCFLNWCVVCPQRDYNIEKGEIGWLMKILLKKSNFDYDLFFSLIKSGEIILPFKMFVENLKDFYMDNGHLHPQNKIIKDRNVSRIDCFVNISDKHDIVKFENIVNQKLRVTNKSDDSNKKKLMDFISENEKYHKLILNVYSKDTEFFNNYNIDITGLK